jgi:hypothetical protein
MMEKAKVETRSFNGVRVVVHTSLTYDVVLGKLRSLMGASTVGEVVALAKKPITEAEFTREVEDRLVGESGFMPFAEIDHGGWLPKFGIAANHALDNWQSALCHHDDPP